MILDLCDPGHYTYQFCLSIIAIEFSIGSMSIDIPISSIYI
jgi:hypothetical protein